jgi:hypothetical protein
MRSALTIIAIVVGLAGAGLARYGSLDPCVMLHHDLTHFASAEFGKAGGAIGVELVWHAKEMDRLDSYACAGALKRLYLDQRPLFPADAER